MKTLSKRSTPEVCALLKALPPTSGEANPSSHRVQVWGLKDKIRFYLYG